MTLRPFRDPARVAGAIVEDRLLALALIERVEQGKALVVAGAPSGRTHCRLSSSVLRKAFAAERGFG